MTVIHKAVAAVVRGSGADVEILAFQHPRSGVQLPRGTVEPDEAPAEAALRELEEESGLRLTALPRAAGQWQRVLDGRFGEQATGRVHLWHLFVLDAPEGLPDSWCHHASGSPEEDGLVFAFHWLPLVPGLADRLHPLFGATVDMLLAHLGHARQS